MDANELRALQAPLKKQYREQPETGRTLARAEATLDLDRVACRVRSWSGETDAGLHPATGGNGERAGIVRLSYRGQKRPKRHARSHCGHRIPPFARRLGSKDPQR
jgi:hypothetical protein